MTEEITEDDLWDEYRELDSQECTCYKYEPVGSKCKRCVLLMGKEHEINKFYKDNKLGGYEFKDA